MFSLFTLARLRSGCIKCMKLFFGYSKYYSVTSMLLELGLPSFDTLMFSLTVVSVYPINVRVLRMVLLHIYVSFNQPNFLCSFYCLCVCACVSVCVLCFLHFCVSMGFCLK